MIRKKTSLRVKNRAQRSQRTAAKVRGSSERPRLAVFVSSRHVSAQVIDDSKHHTIVSSSTLNLKATKGTLTDKAQLVGEDIAKKALAKKVKKVNFDRHGKKYHGRIKALADAARNKGLEI